MNPIYQEKIGMDRWAKFDMSISRMRIANHKHQPCASCALIYCLQNGDREAAEIIYEAQKKTNE